LVVVGDGPPAQQECCENVEAWNEGEQNGVPEDEWLRDPIAEEWTYEP